MLRQQRLRPTFQTAICFTIQAKNKNVPDKKTAYIGPTDKFNVDLQSNAELLAQQLWQESTNVNSGRNGPTILKVYCLLMTKNVQMCT